MTELPRSLAFDRVADQYDETRGGPERGAAMADVLLPRLPRHPVRVLEIGIGTGAVAEPLRRADIDVVGIDLSRRMLERARARLGSRVAVADAHRLPVRDRAVGAAYAVWVLHLVGDVGRVLREAARVLVPPGRLFVVPGESKHGDLTELDVVLRRLSRAVWRRPDAPDRVIALAADAGLRLAERVDVPVGRFALTPAEAARRIDARTYSFLWDVDEEAWQRTVVPVLDELRALPEQDRPRVAEHAYELLVFDG